MKGTERPGIYAIEHLSGKCYVGSASNISKRWSRHRADLRLGKHRNLHLQAAWDRDGEAAFTFRILEITEDLTAREQHWIDALGVCDPGKGYNKAPTARSSRGRKATEEERAKRRAMGCDWLNTPEAIARRVRTRSASYIPRTEKVPNANPNRRKLTMDQVRQLREEVKGHTFKRGKQPKGSPRLTYKVLADRYGVSLSVIWEAIHGKTYEEGGGSAED